MTAASLSPALKKHDFYVRFDTIISNNFSFRNQRLHILHLKKHLIKSNELSAAVFYFLALVF